ncbi:carboxymuconolactone decarboxylase family protein [Streptomyces paradoxus]|uniref:carboxymuconolactone decarboxylase family protein n=1 Tax=Streptomyces paradoxus TaxID=66375 RepID=UPI0036FC8B8E
MKRAVRMVLRKSLRQIRHVRAVDPPAAEGLVAAVYTRAEQDFGVVAPPLALHSPAPVPLAATWLLLRETLLADQLVDRSVKEAVATAVSRANACPYCVEVHEAKLDTLPPVVNGVPAAVAEWAQGTVRPRGPKTPLPVSFSPAEAAEVYGVAFTFHYLNRMVSVFLDESPVPERTPRLLRGTIMRAVARVMAPDSPGPLKPGASLGLLPAAEPPDGLEWAEPSPVVAGAVSRAIAAVADEAHWVPAGVRQRLEACLETWDRQPVGPSRTWLEEAVGKLPAAELPAARLALLTAFAPYQVLAEDVSSFRRYHSSDKELIALTSWAALTTAVHILAGSGPAAPPRAADMGPGEMSGGR